MCIPNSEALRAVNSLLAKAGSPYAGFFGKITSASTVNGSCFVTVLVVFSPLPVIYDTELLFEEAVI